MIDCVTCHSRESGNPKYGRPGFRIKCGMTTYLIELDGLLDIILLRENLAILKRPSTSDFPRAYRLPQFDIYLKGLIAGLRDAAQYWRRLNTPPG